MKVKELRKILYSDSIDDDEDVKVILNGCECKEINYAYYSLEFMSFTIHI